MTKASSVTPTIAYVSTELEMLAAEASSVQTIIVQGSFTLTGVRNFTKHIKMLKGSIINCPGYTIRLLGPFSAPLSQCFIPFNASNPCVHFGTSNANNHAQYICPEWFGAKGDGSTDDTTAMQAALNASYFSPLSFVPVKLTPLRIYQISALTLPQRCTLYSEAKLTAAPRLRCNTAGVTMLTPVTASVESYIKIYGISLDGNSLASKIININDNRYFEICDCYVGGATSLAIDHYSGGLYNKIHDNWFYNNASCIKLGNYSNFLTIEKNNFYCGSASTGNNIIEVASGSPGAPDSLLISRNSFDGGGGFPSSVIKSDLTYGSWSRTGTISDNRFEVTAPSGIINISNGGRFTIQNNLIGTGSTTSGGKIADLIVIGGRECLIENNFFDRMTCTNAAINLTSTSNSCRVGYQQWDNYPGGGPFGAYVVDSGTLNRSLSIVQKGSTAARPSGLSATLDMGLMYLDTTLSTSGTPIFWNGTGWVATTTSSGGGSFSSFTWSTSEQEWPFEKDESGRTLYCKVVDTGLLPNTGVVYVNHNISSLDVTKVYRLYARCYWTALPLMLTLPCEWVYMGANATQIRINTSVDFSTYTSYSYIIYAK